MKAAVDFSRIHNVLILRTDHLGDLLLSTPLIRTLRQALPGRRFTLVASPANNGALTDWDGIDEIRLFDPQWPLLQKWQFARELGREQWDLCLTLSPRTPSYILGWMSGAPIRTGIVYSRRALARLLSPLWLTHPVVMSVDELLAEKQPAPHEVLQLAAISTALGLPETEPGPLEIALNPADVVWAQKQLGQQPLTLVGIHGAGKWLLQGWTAADFLALVRSVLSGCTAANLPPAKLLLTFGPGDGELAAAVTQALALQPNPEIILPGPLSIPRWAAFASLCDVIITPDTGSLHLAVAVNRPVVAMYEASTFLHCSTQWAPWQVPHALIRRDIPAVTIPVIVAETLRLLSAETSGDGS